jgi:hypothetical protein
MNKKYPKRHKFGDSHKFHKKMREMRVSSCELAHNSHIFGVPLGLRNLKSRNLKSQAALEFLVTYSWAFLAILITMGSLYYFGILDFQRYLPERCLFTSQLECINFVMNSGDQEIKIKISNNLGEQIRVQTLTITNDDTPALSCVNGDTLPLDWNAGDEKDFTFTTCSSGGFLEDERVEAKITMTYIAPATSAPQPEHTVNGKIQGRVQ